MHCSWSLVCEELTRYRDKHNAMAVRAPARRTGDRRVRRNCRRQLVVSAVCRSQLGPWTRACRGPRCSRRVRFYGSLSRHSSSGTPAICSGRQVPQLLRNANTVVASAGSIRPRAVAARPRLTWTAVDTRLSPSNGLFGLEVQWPDSGPTPFPTKPDSIQAQDAVRTPLPGDPATWQSSSRDAKASSGDPEGSLATPGSSRTPRRLAAWRSRAVRRRHRRGFGSLEAQDTVREAAHDSPAIPGADADRRVRGDQPRHPGRLAVRPGCRHPGGLVRRALVLIAFACGRWSRRACCCMATVVLSPSARRFSGGGGRGRGGQVGGGGVCLGFLCSARSTASGQRDRCQCNPLFSFFSGRAGITTTSS